MPFLRNEKSSPIASSTGELEAPNASNWNELHTQDESKNRTFQEFDAINHKNRSEHSWEEKHDAPAPRVIKNLIYL